MPHAPRAPNPAWIIALLAAIALAVVYWSGWQRPRAPALQQARQTAPLPVAADAIVPANEGRLVRIAGMLEATAPVQDTGLGVRADAVALLRSVQMFQWQEHCERETCAYMTGWSDRPIDSRAFREPAGHRNPGFPFSDARFVAAGLRLGAFTIDPRLVDGTEASVAYLVQRTQLTPNLAASFTARDGILYSGAGPDHPAVGDLRVSYRVVPVGHVVLNGIQRGDRLQPPHPEQP